MMPETYPDTVCADCLDDEALKTFIRANLTSEDCGYCQRSAEQPLAADLNDLVAEIEDGIEFEWTDPANELAYETAEGGYQGEVLDAQDLFDRIGLPTSIDLLGEAMIAKLRDKAWCERDYYAGPTEDRLMYGWNEFKDRVKHGSRYFFLNDDGMDVVRGPADFGPAAVLDRLGKAIQAAGMLRQIEIHESIYRARIHHESRELSLATDLGTPPREHAVFPNRASAAGIPMFYGSLEAETALTEILQEEVAEGKVATVGQFRVARPLQIIDLTAIPLKPSLYDRAHRNLRSAAEFLKGFEDDFSAPVEKNGMEHIEYVPTQVVTEYFRHVFRHEGRQIDGLKYRSARRSGGTCLVLFCESDGCRDQAIGWEAIPGAVLGLQSTEKFTRARTNALRVEGRGR